MAAVAERRHPVRTCVACRTERQKRDLVRVVRAPDGGVRFDPERRAAGRGAYLCADGSCWATALKRGSLQHALKTTLPADIRDRLAAGPEPTTQGGVIGA